jgi:hypothetical protein
MQQPWLASYQQPSGWVSKQVVTAAELILLLLSATAAATAATAEHGQGSRSDG